MILHIMDLFPPYMVSNYFLRENKTLILVKTSKLMTGNLKG